MTNSIQEMTDFLHRAKHINVVLDNLSKNNKADRNDIYDLVYSKRKIEDWLSIYIENKDIKKDLEDILIRIDNILKVMNDDYIEELLSKDIKNPHKLNKAKYEVADKFKDLKDKGNKQKGASVETKISRYIKTKIPALTILTILLILPLLIPKISLVPIFEDKKEVANEQEKIVEDEEKEEDAFLDYDIKPDKEVVEDLIGGLSTILNILIVMVVAWMMLSVTLDLLYIGTNGLLNNNSPALFSAEAITVQETMRNIIVDGDVNTNDRLEVARALLNNTLEYMHKIKFLEINYDVDTDSNIKHKIKNIEDIIKELSEIRDRINNEKGLKLIEAYVDAELAYELYEQFIIKNKDMLNDLI